MEEKIGNIVAGALGRLFWRRLVRSCNKAVADVQETMQDPNLRAGHRE